MSRACARADFRKRGSSSSAVDGGKQPESPQQPPLARSAFTSSSTSASKSLQSSLHSSSSSALTYGPPLPPQRSMQAASESPPHTQLDTQSSAPLQVSNPAGHALPCCAMSLPSSHPSKHKLAATSIH